MLEQSIYSSPHRNHHPQARVGMTYFKVRTPINSREAVPQFRLETALDKVCQNENNSHYQYG